MTIAEMGDGSGARGEFDARYLAFLTTVADLRPSLHRYCARMTGSVADGEDVVQDALFDAYRRLESFDGTRRLEPWLFRIAHNRCVDFLRHRGVREDAESVVDADDRVWPDDPPGPALGRAVEHLVLTLPSMERACVLLKDVLDHSLDEIAELTGSTLGGVKAALHRGRAKLAASPVARGRDTDASPDTRALLARYVERFNRRDWDGLREMVSADTRIRVADRFAGRLVDSPYFSRYERFTVPIRLRVADVDGEPMIVAEYARDGVWTSGGVIRVVLREGRIVEIGDYHHCPWVLGAADEVRIG